METEEILHKENNMDENENSIDGISQENEIFKKETKKERQLREFIQNQCIVYSKDSFRYLKKREFYIVCQILKCLYVNKLPQNATRIRDYVQARFKEYSEEINTKYSSLNEIKNNDKHHWIVNKINNEDRIEFYVPKDVAVRSMVNTMWPIFVKMEHKGDKRMQFYKQKPHYLIKLNETGLKCVEELINVGLIQIEKEEVMNNETTN